MTPKSSVLLIFTILTFNIHAIDVKYLLVKLDNKVGSNGYRTTNVVGQIDKVARDNEEGMLWD